MEAGFFPLFLPSRTGANYALYMPVAKSATTLTVGSILWLQPFAEEANCARRHMVAAAQECQSRGIASLILDLSGCGESDGELAGASLDDWLNEIRLALEWLEQSTGGPAWLGGLRAGALLAAQVAASRSVGGVVLWQPVLTGRAVIDQFLRQQLAVDWARGSAANAAQILADLRETLARGDAITVAGYTLSARLAAGLGEMEISVRALARSSVVLLESRSVGTAASGLSPGLEQLQKALHAAGSEVSSASCEAASFWGVHEAPLTPVVAQVLAGALQRAMPPHRGTVRTDSVAERCTSSPSGLKLMVLPVAQGVAVTLHDRYPRSSDAVRTNPGMGVIMLTGGMQIRAGSHRQYILLARALATEGHTVLRMDFPGLGDSPGAPRHYAENADAITAAIAALRERRPDLPGIVLWGLCDGASAAALHACVDEHVAALMMVNPWLDDVPAHAGLSGYYRQRFMSYEFWRRLVRGEVGAIKGVVGLLQHLLQKVSMPMKDSGKGIAGRERDLWSALASLSGRVTVITSGADRTGQAFLDMLVRRPDVQQGITRLSVPQADHTFSAPQWHAALVDHTRIMLAEEMQRLQNPQGR